MHLLHILPLAAVAHASFTKIPSGNGYGTAVFDTAAAKIVALREHVYQSVDAGVATRDLVYDAYFGVRAAGKQAWLTSTPVDSASLDGNLITVVQRFGGLTATARYFASFRFAAPSLVMILELKNEGAQPIADVHAFSIANAHLGEGDGTVGQRVDWNGEEYVQKGIKSGRVMTIRPLVLAPQKRTTTPRNPFSIVQGGALFGPDVDSSGDANDVASGFEWDRDTLGPGEQVTVGVLLAYHPFGDVAALDRLWGGWHAGQDPSGILPEQAQWDAWYRAAKLPPGLSPDEQKLYRQQLAILRMGQVAEPNDVGSGYLPHGQIVASLRPGQWDTAWVRDGCLATEALARAGFLDEARASLEFMLRAEAGLYAQYVGGAYRISVVRYLGKGKEESDRDANGPNIELDGFGMFLAAVGAWLDAGGDPAFVDQWWSTLRDGVADVLAGLVDPQMGLVHADSSIWESHWDNGGRRHYTWTSAWAASGLDSAARLADPRDPTRARHYREVAAALRGAIAARLATPDGVLRPSLEDQATVDAAALEALNLGAIDPTGRIASATLDAVLAKLAVASGHGLKRNQNGGAYDEREWIVIDLRASTALRRAGRAGEAEALWAWVRDQALQNHGLIPELYDQTTADYAGEVPMVGFGAGAFVKTAWERAAASSTDGGIGPDSGDGGGPTAAKSCACTLGAAKGSAEWRASGVFWLLAGLLLRRRMRTR